MIQDNKKIAIVGTGMVGMSLAYALLNQSICDEICLIDINKIKARGEAMDLTHGLPFAPHNIKIYAGEYKDCKDMDLVVICAGAPRMMGETRRDLVQKNYIVFKSIIPPIVNNGFNGIFLVATNPVDVMSKLVLDLSGFEPGRVFGTGTALDTARLRFILSEYFEVNPNNIHTYVLGEHGDSEFVAWNSAFISSTPLMEYKAENSNLNFELDNIAHRVKRSAYEIIRAKKVTCYGIGMVLARLASAILHNENSVFTVSAYLQGEYGKKGAYIGVPAIINREGVKKIIEVDLSEKEAEQLGYSFNVILDMLSEIDSR